MKISSLFKFRAILFLLSAMLSLSWIPATYVKKNNISRYGYVLHLKRTKAKQPEGTVLLMPGDGYTSLNLQSEGDKSLDTGIF